MVSEHTIANSRPECILALRQSRDDCWIVAATPLFQNKPSQLLAVRSCSLETSAHRFHACTLKISHVRVAL
jgi:hypothetical protein